MKALAILFFPAIIGAFALGVRAGEARGSQQMLDQAQAAFDSCAAAYGDLARRVRGEK